MIERGAGASTDRSHLAAIYIPKIEAEQINLVAGELHGEQFSIQFDGTTRVGEAIACVGRFCTSQFQLRTRLIMLKTTLKHVKARQLAAIITELLCTTLRLPLPASHVVSMCRDSASVNASACRRLCQNPFTAAAQFLCMCHTLNNAGAHIVLPTLNEWMTPWLELVGGSDPHRGAQTLWKDTVAPATVPGYSKTRWYAKAEIQFVLAEQFDKLGEFLDELDELEYGDASRKKLRAIFDCAERKRQLELELAAMLDLKRLVQETYALEGDGLEVLLVYRRLEALRKLGVSIRHHDDGCLPNVQALLRSQMKLEPGVEIQKDFPPHGCFPAFIISSATVDSTLYPGTEVVAYKVRYPSDNQREDLEEDELQPLLKTNHLHEFEELCDTVYQAFC